MAEILAGSARMQSLAFPTKQWGCILTIKGIIICLGFMDRPEMFLPIRDLGNAGLTGPDGAFALPGEDRR
jgi:hypothetical protein